MKLQGRLLNSEPSIAERINNVTDKQLQNFTILWMRKKCFDKTTKDKSLYFFNQLKIFNPDVPKYKILCASLGSEVSDLAYYLKYGTVERPSNEILKPVTYEDFELLDLSRVEWDEPAAKAKPSSPNGKQGVPNKNYEDKPFVKITDDITIEHINGAQYRPWRLTIKDREYYIRLTDMRLAVLLLQSETPLCKSDVLDLGISFQHQNVYNLEAEGLIQKFKKAGRGRTIFYTIATDTYQPAFMSDNDSPFKEKPDDAQHQAQASPQRITLG